MIRTFIHFECVNVMSRVALTIFYTIKRKRNLTRKGVVCRQHIQLICRATGIRWRDV